MSDPMVVVWNQAGSQHRGVRCPTCQKWFPLPSTAPYLRSRTCDHCKGTVPYPSEAEQMGVVFRG